MSRRIALAQIAHGDGVGIGHIKGRIGGEIAPRLRKQHAHINCRTGDEGNIIADGQVIIAGLAGQGRFQRQGVIGGA